MASLLSRRLARSLGLINMTRVAYSTSAEPPALLQTLKTDLKTAMRAKDQPRLSAIRGVLSAVTNLSKTDKPVQTDQHMVALMQKQLRSMAEAAADFRGAGRDDLVEKEEATMAHLRAYVRNSGVQVLDGDELARVVKEVILAARADGADILHPGAIMKKLLGPGGALEEKSVDKAEVARVVKTALEPI